MTTRNALSDIEDTKSNGAFPIPRRFYLERMVDETGISGTGVVTTGVVFPDGTVVQQWRGETSSLSIFPNLDDMIKIHGHQGKTVVRWIDA